jgi:hypothetical protein
MVRALHNHIDARRFQLEWNMARKSTETTTPVVIYELPKSAPLPENYIDGMAEFLEGDEDFEYPSRKKSRHRKEDQK